MSYVEAQGNIGGACTLVDEFQINNHTTNSQSAPSVSTFSNGNFVVTWHSSLQDGFSNGVYGQLFNVNGDKVGDEFQVNTHVGGDQSRPSVSVLPNNDFVVTWNTNGQDGSDYGIYGQLFDGTGVKMGDEFQVNTYITDKQARPTVSAFNNNGFVVTWRSYEQDGSDYGIYGQLFNGTGVKMGEEFQVNNYTSGDQSIPSMSVFSNDDFIVVWHSNGQDGSNYGVFGRLFNGTGAKKGEEFQVNSHTSNSQSQPSVSVFPNNDFVVTW
eukprot:CAMPEP_0117428246 /NCGR_PEP_ID=MMETSP0758-20121206/7997_1 /TAXON_ID=63605 /ORGANISM="Percolomonas cosmopolitus, Strain AE-1 (ATCC 50343)" /LENGTH=267 /DNA_ID=CAMNT_0005214497 /DNA_START=121 /DNA_END=921 /DNA_ORIENTATION=+